MENSLKKYSSSSVTGESWTRAKRIVIENPLNLDNLIKFIEEKVIIMDGEYIHLDQGILDMKLGVDDLSTTFDIIDVTTGEPTGEKMSYGTLHSIIFSVYMALALERDSGETTGE